MRALSQFGSDRSGTSAAEFAMVLPLLLLFLLGLIDAGRFMWECNRAEKATQMGTRFAVATDPVASGLTSYSFATTGEVAAGSSVPTANFDKATCDNSSCSCSASTGAFCDSVGYNGTAFSNTVARMAAMYPPIQASNVQVEYRNAGLGFAGNPDGPDVSPLVTVRLSGLTFRPISMLFLSTSLPMPGFDATLSLEDASGNQSN